MYNTILSTIQMNPEQVYENIRSGVVPEFNGTTTESLRKFHNWIKLQLILDAKRMTFGTKLLDVAVGRGGDILKWSKAKFRYVTGFDSDSKSIYEKNDFDGAIKRYSGVKSQMNMPKCYFWNLSATDPFILTKLNGKDRDCTYDVVSCQFSFHYFVQDIDIVLNMIAKKLRTGGVFIGTAMNGERVKQILSKGNIKNNAMIVECVDENMYTFTMNSEKTSRETYFEYRGASTEYYLYKEYFIEKCKTFNLFPVIISDFHEWNKKYTGQELSLEDMYCSFLNFSFMFQKY